MKNKWSVVCILTVCMVLLLTFSLDRSVDVINQTNPVESSRCVIIDAGHGGADGGAVSCTGACESHINLEISLRLRDLVHLLGYRTKMIRTGDQSIYTQGDTIHQQKVSDLKERVRIVNETAGAVLLSIHQNYYPDGRYYGPQVFYNANTESKDLAALLQQNMTQLLTPKSGRKEKRSQGIFLLEQVQGCAVLIECGFLSHEEEEARLRDPEYQKRICAVIAASTASFLSNA